MTLTSMEPLDLSVPLGGRVLVVADMLLGRTSSPSSEVAASEVAGALAGWDGPGVVVFAGGLFDMLGDDRNSPSLALAAHPRLAGALRAFTAEPNRRTICLPGPRAGPLAGDRTAQKTLRSTAAF